MISGMMNIKVAMQLEALDGRGLLLEGEASCANEVLGLRSSDEEAGSWALEYHTLILFS